MSTNPEVHGGVCDPYDKGHAVEGKPVDDFTEAEHDALASEVDPTFDPSISTAAKRIVAVEGRSIPLTRDKLEAIRISRSKLTVRRADALEKLLLHVYPEHILLGDYQDAIRLLHIVNELRD